MQLDTNVFQTGKPPSLEEGPMSPQANNENSALNRVEKGTNCQPCMNILKVILYLQLIIFLGWIGGIFITNYHLGHPHTDDNMPQDQLEWISDFNKVDSSDNSESIPKDVIVTWIKEINEDVRTERTEASTTPVIDYTNDFFEMESTTPSTKILTEEDEIALMAKMFNDLIKEDNDEERKKSDETTSAPKENFDESKHRILTTPKSEIIHVLDYAQYDYDIDMKVKAPFPIPMWMKKPTVIPDLVFDFEDGSWFSKTKVENRLSKPGFPEPELPPTEFPESEIEDVIEDHTGSDIIEKPMPPQFSNHRLQKRTVSDGVVDSDKKTQENVHTKVTTNATVEQQLLALFEYPLSVLSKKSNDSAGSTSEKQNVSNDVLDSDKKTQENVHTKVTTNATVEQQLLALFEYPLAVLSKKSNHSAESTREKRNVSDGVVDSDKKTVENDHTKVTTNATGEQKLIELLYHPLSNLKDKSKNSAESTSTEEKAGRTNTTGDSSSSSEE